ncbi:hypothetical protein P4H87_03660, partial [Paenibacillus macerans]|nr:hypothetical protein [Paenibacillus macerans]
MTVKSSWKRWAALPLAALMFAAAGCGGGNGGGGGPEASPAATSGGGGNASSEGPLKLSIMLPVFKTNYPKDDG